MKWVLPLIFGAVVCVMLLAIQPVGAQVGGSCAKLGEVLNCTYVEHNTGMVYDFHARSTSGSRIVTWGFVTEDITDTTENEVAIYPDHGKFHIDQESGVLTFKDTPDFEMPVDADGDNEYKVMVKAEIDTTSGKKSDTQGVIITVTNKEELGAVTLNNLQPQVMVLMSATLEDADGAVSGASWQWYTATSRNGGNYDIIEGATGDSYRPTESDIGKYLRATVRYIDGHSAEVDTTAGESMYPVRVRPTGDNSAPVFAEGEIANRNIDENVPVGTNVGPPVVAIDNEPGVLTYSLSGTDATMFGIDLVTGQLTTKADLNHENVDGDSYEVVVTATDPFGSTDMISITVAVNDLNEAPEITSGPALITHVEGETVIDANSSTDALDALSYTATDEDDGHLATIVWELTGPDKDLLQLDTTSPGGTSPVISFVTAPDFETPMDVNKDNIYMVTVVAMDSMWATGTKDVAISVSNVDEPGTIRFSHIQPEVGVRLLSALDDPDGGITGLKWQWSIQNATSTPAGDIVGATSDTYTPTAGDIGGTLTVTATYEDRVRNEDDEDTADVDESEPTVLASVGGQLDNVRANVPSNIRPFFVSDTSTSTKVTVYTRYIKENSDAGSRVVLNVDGVTEANGDDVDATDSDDSKLQYELGGTDKAHFTLLTDESGAATSTIIQTKESLDYESKKRYVVTVKATDPSGGSATATVTIHVVNENESPTIDGPAYIEYMENSLAAVGSFVAKDPEGSGVSWAKSGQNEGKFSLSDTIGSRTTLTFGELTFGKQSPDYEIPEGGTGSSNIYEVTLKAMVAGTNDIDCATSETCVEHTVMIMVSDVEETPEFRTSSITLAVEEGNTNTNVVVDSPVVATDGDGDMLTYSLSGTDAEKFLIIPATGQIYTNTILDYETKRIYSIVVTATDQTGRSDSINVTIEVLDVEEGPKIIQSGIAISGPVTVNYAENGNGDVATYDAEGPTASSASWSLEGTDANKISLNDFGETAVLRFLQPPDYENPLDANSDNTYQVTLRVTDGDIVDTQEYRLLSIT